jgi:hypothetical protein
MKALALISRTVSWTTRRREYGSLDVLVSDLSVLRPRDVRGIKILINNEALSLELQVTSAEGMKITVSGNAVDAEGVRTELDRHLGRRATAPAWVRNLLVAIITVSIPLAVFVTLLRSIESTAFLRVAFPVSIALLATSVLGAFIVSRTYPRLELIQGQESKEASLKRRAAVSLSYLSTAALGGLADHFLR